MTLNQLRIFVAVANQLSLTKAARDIHIRQPSVSKQLKHLEHELRVRLYARKEQGVKLTQEGQLFLDHIKPILQQIEEVKKLFTDEATQTKIPFLKLASNPSPSTLLLPKALNEFKKTHPHLNLFFWTADTPTIERMVLNREIDIGVITELCSNVKLIAESLCSEKVLAVVSAKNPLAKKSKLTEEEVSHVPIIGRVGGKISQQLQEMGLKLHISMRCEPIDVIKSAVESGLGMGFFHRNIVEPGIKKGDLKAIKIPYLKKVEVKWYILYLSNVPLSHEAQDFLSVLHQTASKLKTIRTYG